MRLFKSALLLSAVGVVFGCASHLAAADAAKKSANVTNGTVKSISGNTLIVTGKNDKEWTYEVGNNAFLACPESKDARVSDLKPGARVSVLWDKKGEDYQAKGVLHREGTFSKASIAQGKVQKVEDDQVVIANEKGKEGMYTVGDSTRIRLKNADAKINSFKSGDDVVFVYSKKGDRKELLSICDCSQK